MKKIAGKLTVLFVDAGPWFGGGQRSLLDLITALRNRDAVRPVLVAADDTPGGLLERAEGLGVPSAHLPARHWQRNLRGLLNFLSDRGRITRVMRRVIHTHRPDFIHANGIRSALAVQASDTCNRPPVVLHARDLREPVAVTLWIAARVAAVVAVSETVARHLRSTVRYRGLLRVIPNGFDLKAIASSVPTKAWPWAPEHRTAVLVADLVRWKRHDLFLKAGRILYERLPRFRGVVVGRPVAADSQGYLAELQELGRAPDGTGIFHFATDVQDALPWIAAADAVVSAAPDEPFGRTVVEALALGKPVVAVGGSGPEEVLAESLAGRICDSVPGSLAMGIQHFLGEIDPTAVAVAARARAGDFAIEKTAADITALYQTLIARG
ncbi:MAG: glycosyltransferase [Kiritimatiellaeota bacterium]|nr:glycosyltransferase [Kiritimatiellota bacterium]